MWLVSAVFSVHSVIQIANTAECIKHRITRWQAETIKKSFEVLFRETLYWILNPSIYTAKHNRGWRMDETSTTSMNVIFLIWILERNCTIIDLMMNFILWVVFDLLISCMWPECWTIDWIQSLFRVSVTIIFHGHLVEWQQRLQVSDRSFVLGDACLWGADEVLNFLLGLLLLRVNQSGHGVGWEWDLQSVVMLLEGVNHSGDWNRLTVVIPVNLGRILRVSGNAKKFSKIMKIYEFSIENYYLINF